MTIPIKDGIWDQLRNGFGQFGLGYRTGVDIPNETPGFKGPTLGSENAGKILDESFGNYDSYSVIQMARYVSAIANGGYLMKPYLVQSISTTGTNNQNNKLIWSNKAEIQGKVDLDNDQWKVIREGMYAVGNGSLEGNTGGSALHELEPKVAAKSGTAETFTDKVETTTASLILYVPGQPVALALAFPGVTPGQFNVNVRTGRDIIEAFYQYVMDKPSEDKSPTAVLSPKNN
jgi:cell division protein FtsI/penicillin-binding protein 2